MRRVLAALLAVLLPLQWGWAVAAATCIDGARAAVVSVAAVGHPVAHDAAAPHDHFGHHAHGSPAPTPDADPGDAPSSAVDCAVCHVPVPAFGTLDVPGTLPRPDTAPSPGASAPVPERPLQPPFRPPMNGA